MKRYTISRPAAYAGAEDPPHAQDEAVGALGRIKYDSPGQARVWIDEKTAAGQVILKAKLIKNGEIAD